MTIDHNTQAQIVSLNFEEMRVTLRVPECHPWTGEWGWVRKSDCDLSFEDGIAYVSTSANIYKFPVASFVDALAKGSLPSDSYIGDGTVAKPEPEQDYEGNPHTDHYVPPVILDTE